ncbi:MAG: hypothetical protein K1X86_15505 [Ignavibacteria bacterium]|nr:hypothetical protein [Ignavibacteria bacterium]
MDNSVKVSKEWLSANVSRFTYNNEPIDEAIVLSLAGVFTSTLTEAGMSEAGKRITEFEIFHKDYGWIRCYCSRN